MDENEKMPLNETDTLEKESAENKQTKEEFFWEIFRFLLVGGTATLVDWAISYAFYGWWLPPALIGEVGSLLLSTALGFVIGLVINWVLSVGFVFQKVKDKASVKTAKSFLTFTAIGVVGLLICELGMLLVPIFPAFSLFGTSTFLGTAWGWWLMKATMTAIVLVWNYIGRKLLIFKA